MKIILCLLLIGIAVNVSAQPQTKAEVAFTIPEKDLIPEGMAFDPTEKNLYVGSIHKRKIVKISQEGVVSDFVPTGQDDLLQVLGMHINNNRLWVCNNAPEYDTTFRQSNIHVYDLKSKKLINKFSLNDGKKHLFNDLFITREGDAYITDTDGNSIYRITSSNQKLEEFLPSGSVTNPNGITSSSDGKRLFVSTGSGRGIVALDIETKEIRDLPNDRYMIFG
ncbi:MAG: hypothetical protein L0Y35_06960, partial [Flammeovirgaceae bacterium]|nr:hypothetical protein [Flammeovirgaceae bacterium]